MRKGGVLSSGEARGDGLVLALVEVDGHHVNIVGRIFLEMLNIYIKFNKIWRKTSGKGAWGR